MRNVSEISRSIFHVNCKNGRHSTTIDAAPVLPKVMKCNAMAHPLLLKAANSCLEAIDLVLEQRVLTPGVGQQLLQLRVTVVMLMAFKGRVCQLGAQRAQLCRVIVPVFVQQCF